MQHKAVTLLAVLVTCVQVQAVMAQTGNVKTDPNQVSVSDTKASDSEYHKTINFAEPAANSTTGTSGETELSPGDIDNQKNSESEQKKKHNSNSFLAIPLLIGAGAALAGSHGGADSAASITSSNSGSVLDPGTTIIKPPSNINQLAPESPSLLNFLVGFVALAGLTLIKRRKGSLSHNII